MKQGTTFVDMTAEMIRLDTAIQIRCVGVESVQMGADMFHWTEVLRWID